MAAEMERSPSGGAAAAARLDDASTQDGDASQAPDEGAESEADRAEQQQTEEPPPAPAVPQGPGEVGADAA